MDSVSSKKILLLNILDILKRYSDESHRLSQKEILDILKREYSMPVDRKAVKRNLMNLLEFGYDLEYSETIRLVQRANKKGEIELEEETIYSDWYLNRDFADAELRLLIDSLLFSKHIPYNQCKKLIKRIERLSSIYFKSKVRHICNMPEKLPENKELFYTIDILDEAISEGKKVAFRYYEYGIDKRRRLRKNKEGRTAEYIVSPYQMAATNGRYYLVCNSEPFDDVSNYRIDRISQIRILDEPVKPKEKVKGLENGFDLPKHMAEHIYMFGGGSVRVKFRATRLIIDDIIDWFGLDAVFSDAADDGVTVTVRINENAMFYWAMQYGEHVEILEPLRLREKVRDAAKAMCEKYQ